MPSLERDGVVLLLFAEVLALLVSGMVGSYQFFAVLLVFTLGTLFALGFVRRARATSWVIPVAATVVLMAAMAGVLAFESHVVAAASDTVLGFHPATAFLVYGIWLPGFFTLAVTFTLSFDRLYEIVRPARGAR